MPSDIEGAYIRSRPLFGPPEAGVSFIASPRFGLGLLVRHRHAVDIIFSTPLRLALSTVNNAASVKQDVSSSSLSSPLSRPSFSRPRHIQVFAVRFFSLLLASLPFLSCNCGLLNGAQCMTWSGMREYRCTSGTLFPIQSRYLVKTQLSRHYAYMRSLKCMHACTRLGDGSHEVRHWHCL